MAKWNDESMDRSLKWKVATPSLIDWKSSLEKMSLRSPRNKFQINGKVKAFEVEFDDEEAKSVNDLGSG